MVGVILTRSSGRWQTWGRGKENYLSLNTDTSISVTTSTFLDLEGGSFVVSSGFPRSHSQNSFCGSVKNFASQQSRSMVICVNAGSGVGDLNVSRNADPTNLAPSFLSPAGVLDSVTRRASGLPPREMNRPPGRSIPGPSGSDHTRVLECCF